jgi:hypothetical protein
MKHTRGQFSALQENIAIAPHNSIDAALPADVFVNSENTNARIEQHAYPRS